LCETGDGRFVCCGNRTLFWLQNLQLYFNIFLQTGTVILFLFFVFQPDMILFFSKPGLNYIFIVEAKVDISREMSHVSRPVLEGEKGGK